MRKYFYRILGEYVRLYARPEDRVVDLDPMSDDFKRAMAPVETVAANEYRLLPQPEAVDYVVMNGNLHYEADIQAYLQKLQAQIHPRTRLIIITYSSLWRPLVWLATKLGLRQKTLEANWLDDDDIRNFLLLTGFELVRCEQRVLVPVSVPILSWFVNRYLAPLPGFRALAMVNIFVARPVPPASTARPSVSIVVPARNEAGNIEAIVARTPQMGPDDEIIFIEGGSTDDTWGRIIEVQQRFADRPIRVARQDGKGKGDAVRKGFAMARNEILMILDADITVPPEDLPKFYEAIASGKAEFVNGSRLVYPMEKKAMRFLNLLGNRFFAAAFSFVLGQRFKDTLCGTKVLTRENYGRLASNRSYFGEFDPFGDFDLIFGASRMGLRVLEVPITYRERTYGTTNISRWTHGWLLLMMLMFASRKLKFI